MQTKTNICAIVAVGPDNVIGRNGVMPWDCKSDMYHFRQTTLHQPCIFGRTTFENLPQKPLPNRFNIVCSSKYPNKYHNNIFYANSIESALQECSKYPTVFICGGAQIYKYAFDNNLIKTLYLTIIKNQTLKNAIRKSPNYYCRFEPNISEFFNSPQWSVEQIKYPENVLPKDTNNTFAEFYKFTLTR